jgi:hypothetical protein
MKMRAAIAVSLVLLFTPAGNAASKKKPLALKVSVPAGGLPLVTLTASDVPLGEVAEHLARTLGTRVDVSAGARELRVTTKLDRQPLDLALRELAPRAYLDGVLAGGTGNPMILAIHLHAAGDAEPPLTELRRTTSDALIVVGNTEDPAENPLAGQLEVTFRNERLHVFAKKQPLSIVGYKIAEALGIPFELSGDPREVVDLAVRDASLEQAMRALPSSVRLYHRKDLATLEVTPVRVVVQAPAPPPDPIPPKE